MKQKLSFAALAFCLSACAFVMLGMANLYFVRHGYLVCTGLVFGLLLLYFARHSVPLPRARGFRGLVCALLALPILLVRSQYFIGSTATRLLLCACAFYSVYCLLGSLFAEASPEKAAVGKLAPSWKMDGALLVLAFAYLLFYSVASLLPTQTPMGDHSIFTLMGKAWNQGLIPYRDTFDHKGPLLFLVYALGQHIHPAYGLFLVQVLSLWAVLSIAYRIPQTGSPSRTWGLLSVFGVLLFLYKMEYGDFLSEAVVLPLLMASTWAAVRYLSLCGEAAAHPPVYAILYGLTAAAAFLCRPTDVITIVVLVACIFFILLGKKQSLNILQNIAAFLLGFCLLAVPFLLYFAAQNALADMLWGSILYNILYAGGKEPYNLWQVQLLVCNTWPVWGLVPLCLLIWKKQSKALLIPCLLAALAGAYLTSSGYRFMHYYIILATLVPVGMMLLRTLDRSQAAGAFLVVLALSMGVSWCGKGVVKEYEAGLSGPTAYEAAVEEIAAQIPQEDRDAVIGYNTKSVFYLHSDLMPCFKYCIMQDWQSMKSGQMQEDNAAFYRSGQAKWVVVESGVQAESVRQAIDENYTLRHSTAYGEDPSQTLLLYQKNS